VWRKGPALLILPNDELELAAQAWADEICIMDAGDDDLVAALSAQLADAAERWRGVRIGVERGPASQPVSYAAMCIYGASTWDAAARAWPAATLVPADGLLSDLRTLKTPGEISVVAAACDIAGHAFAQAGAILRPGLRESEAAASLRTALDTAVVGEHDRAAGFVFCMSGANAAEAYRAYARSSAKPLARGDLVLVHCNSHLNGYWTDITRTYCLGAPDGRQRTMYEAVFAARQAALGVIRPGVTARSVDHAARATLGDRGFGDAFKHGLGHGVGFAAIDHTAHPRLAPTSKDVLEHGMVCNIEPAIYLEGYGGIRHCDVVAVTESGAEVLTPFQASPEALALSDALPSAT